MDVLTLSATPIPRTLNMALSGIRDMSTIEEPPQDRLPVQTFVMEHDWGVVSDAIRRELQRGGQVYYLHNRIDNIEKTARKLHELFGRDVSIGIARPDGQRKCHRLGYGTDERRENSDFGVHHHHRNRHRHPQREHADHRGRRIKWALPSCTR